VSHHNSELFALRRLLSVIKGATSFEDMATYDGVVHSSFQSACKARGMLADDSEFVDAMQEIISTTVSVSTIRRLFARMLVHGAPDDPQSLFHMFAEDLSDPADGAVATNVALLALESIVQELGRSLSDADFGFDLPSEHVDPISSERRRRRIETGISPAEAQMQCDNLLRLFTEEQHQAMTRILESLESGQPCQVFAVIASAGCGKTVFANGLAAYLRARNRSVMCVAASALAAMLLTGGRTAHSALHIPIPCNDSSTCNLTRDERIELRRVDVIIYDECSMVHADVADTVERSLRDVMGSQQPFGGKCVIFMGDFKQLLPVVRYGKGFNFTIQRCAWWKLTTILKFSKNWRAALNPEYTQWLDHIGHGVIEHVEVPISQRVATYADLIEVVYGDCVDCPQNKQILALTLETCATINQLCFAKMPGLLIESPAADSYIDCFDPDAYPRDYVESVQMKGAPPFMLPLKIGAKYMCIKNIDTKRGVINGTMLRLISTGRRFAQFRILSGRSAGSIELLTKMMFTITTEASGLPFTILRRQYPIIPAYCLSVHKAQGQSLEKMGIVFESDPFTHGQLYVAFSRVGGWSHAYVYHQGSNIKNIVMKHLLQ
jgi:hypothetical protein